MASATFLRSTLPIGLAGSSSSSTNSRGTLYPASEDLQWARIASTSSDAPGSSTTAATTCSPWAPCRPTTAQSAMPGAVRSTASTSDG